MSDSTQNWRKIAEKYLHTFDIWFSYRGVFDLRSMLCFVKFKRYIHIEKCSIQLFAIEITLKINVKWEPERVKNFNAARGTRV